MRVSKINYYSRNLKNKIAKKNVPRKLIICHGRKCKKYQYIKNYYGTLYMDIRSSIKPDICMDIHKLHKIKPLHLKSHFKYISSLYAPVPVFFNKKLSYLDFTSLDRQSKYSKKRESVFCDHSSKILCKKILESKYYFNRNFILSLLYLLQVGGSFEFVDNFLFEIENLSDKNAISIVKKFLGSKKKYFDVQITSNSKCIKYERRAQQQELQNKFIVIKKIKEYG
jgi:hypothetical protein